jgi:hypothetical protein
MTSISIMTLSITTLYHYAEYRILCIVMLNVVMLSVVTPVFKVPTPLLLSISPSSTLQKVPGKGSGANVTKSFIVVSYKFSIKLG